MTICIDASAAAEYLLRTALGQQVAQFLGEADLVAPALLDAEVLAVLRREVLRKRLAENRASQAVDDLRDWDVERVAHRSLLRDAWSRQRKTRAQRARRRA